MVNVLRTGMVSELTGISKRTLQRYEKWGLISPKKSEAGYMLFSEEDLFTLFIIKLFKDLGYSMDAIKEALSSPDFDVRNSLDGRIAELEDQLRKDRERLIVAKEVRELIRNEDGPNKGEALCALLRHPEYAWALAGEEDEDGKEILGYFKWVESTNDLMAASAPEEMSSTLDRIIEESGEFGPAVKILTRLILRLLELRNQGVPAGSEETNSAIRDALSAMEEAYGEVPCETFYLLGKGYGSGKLTPPRMLAQLDDRSTEEPAAAQSYIGDAIESYIGQLEMSEESLKRLEKLES